LLISDDVEDFIEDMRDDFARRLKDEFLNGHPNDWDLDGLKKALLERLVLESDPHAWLASEEVETSEDMQEKIVELMANDIAGKEAAAGAEQLKGFEKWLLLQVLDHHWKEHLLAMDHLRQSVGLRGYAQKQPIQEYKRESFELFSTLIGKVREETCIGLHRVRVEAAVEPEPVPQPEPQKVTYISHSTTQAPVQSSSTSTTTFARKYDKIGRNDPCPCGSGKKYKQCHGKR